MRGRRRSGFPPRHPGAARPNPGPVSSDDRRQRTPVPDRRWRFVRDDGHRTSMCPAGPTCLRVSPAAQHADRTRPRRLPVQRCKTTRAGGLAFRTRRSDPSPVAAATLALCGPRIVPRTWCRPSPTWPRAVSVFADKKRSFGSPIADFTCALMSSMGDKPAADVVDRRQERPRGALRGARRAAIRVDGEGGSAARPLRSAATFRPDALACASSSIGRGMIVVLA